MSIASPLAWLFLILLPTLSTVSLLYLGTMRPRELNPFVQVYTTSAWRSSMPTVHLYSMYFPKLDLSVSSMSLKIKREKRGKSWKTLLSQHIQVIDLMRNFNFLLGVQNVFYPSNRFWKTRINKSSGNKWTLIAFLEALLSLIYLYFSYSQLITIEVRT